MSPEQARGRATDKRTDVWAFGCVLFEMLSGKRAFPGEDVTDIIAAVVRAEPDWSALPASVPEHIRVLIRRCLDKDRRSRISDVAVARFLMNETPSLLGAAPSSQLPAAAPPSRRRSLLWSVAGLVAGVSVTAAAAAAFFSTRAQDASVPIRFTITPSPQPLFLQGNGRDIAITPDGRHIIYIAGLASQPPQLLMARDVTNLEAKVIASSASIRHPFTSPDGRWIGFFTNEGLSKVSIDGGPSITLCPSAAPRGADWNEDDTIVFGTAETTVGLFSVSAHGGTPAVVSKPDTSQNESDHLFPSFLPGGNALLLTVTFPTGNSRVDVLDLTTGQRQPLLPAAMQASYVDTGHLVYAASGTLFAIPFDPDTRATTGDAVPIVEQLMMINIGAEYAVSRQGSFVYLTGTPTSAARMRTLVWVNRQGREEPVEAPARAYATVRISPDGTRAALDIRDRANDVWIWDFKRQTLAQLTFAAGLDMSPVWTSDSQRIVWASVGETGTPVLTWQSSDGRGSAERLTTAGHVQFPASTSRDGKLFLFEGSGGSSQVDISVMTLPSSPAQPSARPPTQTLLDNVKAMELNPEISPDGRWIAYQSNKSGQHEIYVSPFPDVNGGLWLVSPSGGSRPAWSSSGRELFYLDGKGLLTVVPVGTSGPAFSAGNPQRLLETAYVLGASTRGFDLRSYDVTADGQRFLMIKESSQGDQPAPSLSLTVVLNAGDDLKARARPKR
jgi:serine/threonine-protein kinase